MPRALTLAEMRREIAALEFDNREGVLSPDGQYRLKRLQNRYSQEKATLPLRIKATREKLARLEANYHG